MSFTIFATCRDFNHPQFGVNQRNAIQSWLKLDPRPEIILMGRDPGTAEFCQEFGLIHHPNNKVNANGIPYLDAMFQDAERLASNDILLLASSDIILFNDTHTAASKLHQSFPLFVASVHRHDVNQYTLIDYNNPDWTADIKHRAVLGHPGCGDYFLYKKGSFQNGVPPFVVGRSSCDNWLIAEAIRLGYCVDLTPVVTIIHLNHDHSHIPGDMNGLLASEEYHHNRRLAGNGVSAEIRNSNWVLTPTGIVKR